MPDAMVGESVGYHSFVPRGRRNMTHRINDLALFHSSNSFVIPRKLLPVSLRFGYNSTTSTTA
jgi:hypothetical protein